MSERIPSIVNQVMTELNEEYPQDVIDDARKRGYQNGEKRGYEKAERLTRERIAKELKGKLTNEEIGQITGVGLNNMDAEQIILKALYDTKRKHLQIAIDDAEKNGFQEGEPIGYAKGEQETCEKIAKKLKNLLTNEEISEFTGLSIDTIRQL